MATLSTRLQWLRHRVAASAFVTQRLPMLIATARNYAQLMRLHKPIGIFLLLWPTLWALWLAAHGRPDPRIFLIFVAGVVLTRSAGCAINDFADRDLDAHVQRTQDRPLADRRIQPFEALLVFFGLSLLALALALTLNALALQVALAGAALLIIYPFVKRFFPMPQAILGLAFSVSIPMAFAAETNAIPPTAWLLLIANVFWTIAYDTMYAMVDREDDLRIGIKSSAILFGDADRTFVALLQLMALITLWLVGHDMNLGIWYLSGLGVAAIFALYQLILIRKREPKKCFDAFVNSNYFGMCVFIGIALDFIFS